MALSLTDIIAQMTAKNPNLAKRPGFPKGFPEPALAGSGGQESGVVAPVPAVMAPTPPTLAEAASGRLPSAMEPRGEPSRVAQFTPKTSASDQLQQFQQSPLPSQMSPAYKAPPVRDVAREASRAGNAMLTAGLFGLGLGSVGGVAAAPTLAAAAGRGAGEGADARFVNAARITGAENDLLEQQAREAESRYQAQLRGFQIAAQDENTDNMNARMMAENADQLAFNREREAGRADEASASAFRREQEVKARERTDFLDRMIGLDAESQRGLLDAAERSGDLDRLGMTEFFTRGADGQWSLTLNKTPKDYSPMQDPQFVALRDRSKRLQELLKPSSNISVEYRAQLSQELADVERRLGVGTGAGLPAEAFMPMSPYQQGQLGESTARRTQQAEQFDKNYNQRQAELDRNAAFRQAGLELQRQGLDISKYRMDFEIKKYLDTEKGEWADKGLKSINEIDTDIASLRKEIARLRTGRTVIDKYGDPLPPIPPSLDEIAAANELVKIMNDKMEIQNAIAGRHGRKRNPLGPGFVPLTGKTVVTPPKKLGSTSGKTGAITLPPISVGGGSLTTPGPSLFNVPGKK
jgi:hypothetical protein